MKMSAPVGPWFVLPGLLVLLSGCVGYDLGRVSEMPPSDSAFATALHQEYVRMARAEADEADWGNAVYFNNKARLAGIGDDVSPQQPAERRLPDDVSSEFETQRSRLLRAIDAHAEDKPTLAARAQASYDCWLEERAENVQDDHVAACRSAFLAALADLDTFPASAVVLLPDPDGRVGVVELSNAGATTTLSKANQGVAIGGANDAPGTVFVARKEDIDRLFGRAMAAVPAPVARLILYFVNDGTELTPASRRQLSVLKDILTSRPAPEVDVVGHTDRVGSNSYNIQLSRARALLVRDRIVALGVDPRQITVSAQGEVNPLVPTADEVAEPRNRRVEIVIR
jgi:OmpA-OmpF porin, OOP family